MELPAEERGVFYWSTKASLARCEVPNMDQTACRSQEFCGRSTAAAQLLPWPHGARMVPRGAQTAHTRFDVDSHGNWRRLTVPQVRTHTPHAWHGIAWHGASHPTLHDAARRLARRQHETHRPTSRHVRAHAHSRAHPPRRPAARRQHEPARRARRPAPACRPAALRGGRGEGRGRGRVQGCGGLN